MAALTRGLVLVSAWLAVALGLWPLQDRPGVLASLIVIVGGTAVLARWRPTVAVVGVSLFAYISYGVVRLLAGAEVAGIPFFLGAFAGLVLGRVRWTRWESPLMWRVPLAWWALGVAVTWPYIAARELGFSLTPSPAAGLIVTAALLQLSLALWMDHLLARDGDGLRLSRWAFVASALATAVAGLYQHGIDPTWLSGDPWIRLGRAVGLMGDANPMGVATATWAPLTVAWLATSPVTAAAGLALSLPLWLGAWVSGARTTLILLAAGFAGLSLAGAGALGWSRRRVLSAGLLAVLVTAAVVVAIGPRVPATSPVGRLVGSLSVTAPRAAAYELFWHRNGYGTAAVAAIREHPWLGVGIGRFWALAPAYAQGAGLTIPPDNAQNLWRHTLVEQGIVGLAPIVWLTVLVATSLVRGGPGGVDLVQRSMVAGLGASLVVGYPVQDPAIAMTVATLICAVARRTGAGSRL